MVVTIRYEGWPIPQAAIDQVARYVRDRLKPADGYIAFDELHEDFKQSCARNAETPTDNFLLVFECLADNLGIQMLRDTQARYCENVSFKDAGEARLYFFPTEVL